MWLYIFVYIHIYLYVYTRQTQIQEHGGWDAPIWGEWVGVEKNYPEVLCLVPEAHQLSSTSKLVEQNSCSGTCNDAWM